MANEIRVGINGFGRIGRVIARIIATKPQFRIAVINEIEPSCHELCYFYNYDSNYGKPANPAEVGADGACLRIGGCDIAVHSERDMYDVPWQVYGTEVIVDTSGVLANVRSARRLVESGEVRRVVVTHSPSSGIDRYVILGVSDERLDFASDCVISSSTCDANAVAQAIATLSGELGIEDGFVTTLHPWLSYQKLTDSYLESQSVPGTYYFDHSLGRASVGSLITKETSLVRALSQVLPEDSLRLKAISYRVPTAIVSSADLTIRTRRSTTRGELLELLQASAVSSPYVHWNEESLVSIDYKGNSASAIYDARWVDVSQGGNLVKVVLWYDNEWGYSNRVVDIVALCTYSNG